MPHLLLISIGPVQEFIASARRSRDLWFGSWLLSELSKTVAREIHRVHGILIFPAPASPDTDLLPDSTLNVANKILAELPDGTPSPTTLMQIITSALQTRLLDQIWKDAYERIKQPNQIDSAAARAQIEDLIELTWVSVPLRDYATSRDTLEHLLAARKTTRSFQPVGLWSQVGRPKSSLDGLRESVIHEDIYDQVQQGMMTEYALFHTFGVRRGERLCGVGLLKRHGRRGKGTKAERFLSTSHVAALPLLQRLSQTDRHALAIYINALRRYGVRRADLGNVPGDLHPVFKHFDGHLLFEERLDEYVPKEHLPAAKTKLKALLHAITGDKTFIPLPYYALLLADGDGMGKAIEALREQPRHRALSDELDRFARAVSRIVTEHNGSLVYAGGDDVLAFVPLHTVLSCARQLADTFRDAMAPFRFKDGQDAPCQPTLSVGIAIAHHLEPLSDALALAREAEQKAKGYPGKNALVVALSKRSGEERTVVGSWDEAPPAIGPLDTRLRQFAAWYAASALPDGLAYELAQLHHRLTPPNNPVLALALRQPMQDAAKRILDRKRTDQAGSQKLDPADAAVLERLIEHFSLDRLANEFIVARIFARAIQQTGPGRLSETRTIPPMQPQEAR